MSKTAAKIIGVLTNAKVLAGAVLALVVFTASWTRRFDALASKEDIAKAIAPAQNELRTHDIAIVQMQTDIEWIKRTLFATARAVGASPSPPP